MAKTASCSPRAVPFHMVPLYACGPLGKALVVNAFAESEVEKTPPPSRTVPVGHVATAETCVMGGFATTANCCVYPCGALAQTPLMTKSSFGRPVALLYLARHPLPL